MQQQRRDFLALLSLMAGAGLLPAGLAWGEEWNNAAFAARNIDELLKSLGAGTPKLSAEVVLMAPEIAENGALVPIEIESKLPDTRSIAILIEKNPNILAANFTIPNGTLPWLQTRVKMAETCNVFVLVNAAGQFYYTTKEVKVTIGGCGG
jgi:sulfur-oxidizing protein SoxY